MKPAFLISILAAAGLPCLCQEPGTLQFDTSNMKVTVSMDRQTYLPGEEAQITLTVSNPGSGPVVSLAPFLTFTSCLYSIRTDTPPPAQLMPGAQTLCQSVPITGSITTTFASGETRRMVLNSYDKLFDASEKAYRGGGVPTTPGAYSLRFEYGASAEAQAEYTVAATKVEADAITRIHDALYNPDPDHYPPQSFPMYVHILALNSGGGSYIVVSQRPVAPKALVVPKTQFHDKIDFDESHAGASLVSPFKRVAAAAAAIVSLSATADAQENLTIEWTDENGGSGHLFYPSSYPARPAPAQRQ